MGDTTKRYVMVIDLRKCVTCHACTVVCKAENGVPAGFFRTWVEEADMGIYPNVTRIKLPRLCNHCTNAPCENVCPVKATYKAEGGVVVVDEEKCIGCRYCIAACPYDARYINPETGTADKCTFCLHRVEAGLEPACVSTCISHSRYFGDLNDPESVVSQLLRTNDFQVMRSDLGTAPSVFYIGLNEHMASKNVHVLRGRR
ncbi:MAG TPA: 4Fe-4S dicluster domain-containing protein [Symbiobacteriaceae bacterium]|nr:4Fe-4S dicluster domain-containing protein [Symbiobacteriaceae bacterium]